MIGVDTTSDMTLAVLSFETRKPPTCLRFRKGHEPGGPELRGADLAPLRLGCGSPGAPRESTRLVRVRPVTRD
jgi:hypothetical protein